MKVTLLSGIMSYIIMFAKLKFNLKKWHECDVDQTIVKWAITVRICPITSP